MSQKLSNSEIEKVFSMYWGCPTTFISHERDGEQIKVGRYFFSDEISDFHRFNSKIELKSLAEISDEHAIEVAKAAGLLMQPFGEKGMIDFGRNMANYFQNNILCGYTIEPLDYVNMVDKFRELGYALPYNGFDLFELGIAITKPQ